jgi:hypothetical protein
VCNKEKNRVNNIIRQIEENHKKNEPRNERDKKLRQQNTGLPYTHMCKVENNTVITQTDQILNRWKEYFCTLLCTSVHFCILLNSDTDVLISNHGTLSTTIDNQTDTEILPPSYNKVCSIINKLKSNKAGGTDNINPELIKQGGRTLKQRIYKLIIMIWGKEQLPKQWNEGIISPLYKKVDRLDCTNYRPITLLNAAYKIFAIT